MPIVHFDDTGLSLLAQFDDSSDLELPVTEGTGGKLERYVLEDADILAAGLLAGIHNVVIRDAVTNERRGEMPFPWDGSAEIVLIDEVIDAANFAAAAADNADDAATAAESVDAKLTPTRASKIDFLDMAISEIETGVGGATPQEVWEYEDRSLTTELIVDVDLDSGGGVLSARIGVAQLTPEEYYEIVQGEDKRITFIVEAKGRFVSASATAITVKFQDTKKITQTVPDDEIDRVTEELDIQVFRAHLTAVQTAALEPGLVIVEIAFDNQKTVLTHAVNILRKIPEV